MYIENVYCNGVVEVDVLWRLLYSHVALFADFNSSLSGLKCKASSFDNFTVRIDPSVLNPRLEWNVVLFFRTILNTRSSPALEWGKTKTSFATLNNRLNCRQPNHVFIFEMWRHSTSIL